MIRYGYSLKVKFLKFLDIASTALKDSRISDQVFKLVLDAIEKYNMLKENIGSKSGDTYASVAIDEMAKQVLLKIAGGKKSFNHVFT